MRSMSSLLLAAVPAPPPAPTKVEVIQDFFDVEFWWTVIAVAGSLAVAVLILVLTTIVQSRHRAEDLDAQRDAQKQAIVSQLRMLREEKSLDAIVELQRAVDALYGTLYEFRRPRRGANRPDVGLAIRDCARVLPIVFGQLTDSEAKSALEDLGVALTSDAMWTGATDLGIAVREAGVIPSIDMSAPSQLEKYVNKMIPFLARRRASEPAERPTLQTYLGRAQAEASEIERYEFQPNGAGPSAIVRKPGFQEPGVHVDGVM